MLTRPDRLRRARDFALLSQKGRAVFAPYFTLRFRMGATPTKVGFVASAKIFKTAVARNRVKRRMREALRALKNEWPKQADLLFILKPEATKAPLPDLIASAKRTFEKMPEAMTRPPQKRIIKAKRPSSIVYRSTSDT